MCKLTSRFFPSVIALALLAVPGPALARGGSDWRDCNGRDVDARITGCSRIIDQTGSRQNSQMRASAFNNRGIAYFSKGEFDRAIRDFDEAIAAKPNNPVLYHNRGMALYNKGDNEAAIRSYDEAISIHPRYAMAFNDRANVYFRLKEYDKAISGYDEAIRLQPRDPVVYANRGNTYRLKGDYDRAIRDLDEAIRLNPREPGLIYGRSQVHADKGDAGRALADLDEAIRLGASNADYYNSRGFLLKQRGEYDRAIRDFDEAIGLKPKFATAFANRGDAWRQRGDIGQAVENGPVLQFRDRSGDKNSEMPNVGIQEINDPLARPLQILGVLINDGNPPHRLMRRSNVVAGRGEDDDWVLDSAQIGKTPVADAEAALLQPVADEGHAGRI